MSPGTGSGSGWHQCKADGSLTLGRRFLDRLDHRHDVGGDGFGHRVRFDEYRVELGDRRDHDRHRPTECLLLGDDPRCRLRRAPGMSKRLKPMPWAARSSVPRPRKRPRAATAHISSYSSGQPTRRRSVAEADELDRVRVGDSGGGSGVDPSMACPPSGPGTQRQGTDPPRARRCHHQKPRQVGRTCRVRPSTSFRVARPRPLGSRSAGRRTS